MPRREFLHVDDMVTACIHVMNASHELFTSIISSPMCSHLNVGSGHDITITELATTIARVVGFNGDIEFDCTKPDGVPSKVNGRNPHSQFSLAALIGIGARASRNLHLVPKQPKNTRS